MYKTLKIQLFKVSFSEYNTNLIPQTFFPINSFLNFLVERLFCFSSLKLSTHLNSQ